MRCWPSSRMALLGAIVLAVTACTPPAAPAPTAAPKPPAAAPTTAPKPESAAAKSDAAPAKPGSVQPQAKTEPAPTAAASASIDSQRALDDARARYYEVAKAEGKLVMYGNTLAPALMDPIKEAFGKTFPGIDIRVEEQTGNILSLIHI